MDRKIEENKKKNNFFSDSQIQQMRDINIRSFLEYHSEKIKGNTVINPFGHEERGGNGFSIEDKLNVLMYYGNAGNLPESKNGHRYINTITAQMIYLNGGIDLPAHNSDESKQLYKQALKELGNYLGIYPDGKYLGTTFKYLEDNYNKQREKLSEESIEKSVTSDAVSPTNKKEEIPSELYNDLQNIIEAKIDDEDKIKGIASYIQSQIEKDKEDLNISINLSDESELKKYLTTILSGKYCYNADAKKLMVYDDIKWKHFNGNHILTNAVEDELNKLKYALYGELKAAKQGEQADAIDKKIKYICSYLKGNNLRNLVNGVIDHTAIYSDKLDKNYFTINTKSSTYNFTDGKWHNHKSSDYITKCSDIDLSEDTRPSEEKIKEWNNYILELCNFDVSLTYELQKVCGCFLTGECGYKKFFIFYGDTTNNGKSTFVSVLKKILGDYAGTVSKNFFAESAKEHSIEQASPALMDTKGKYVCFSSEPKQSITLDAAKIKGMTGNEPQTGRYLHGNTVTFINTAKFVLDTNYLPKIDDTTIFTSNRAMIIPFTNQFENDVDFESRILNDVEFLQAGFMWMMKGYELLKTVGFTPCTSMSDALQEYREVYTEDKVEVLLEDIFFESENQKFTLQFIWEKYKEAYQTDHKQMALISNSRQLKKHAEKLGYICKKERTGQMIYNK